MPAKKISNQRAARLVEPLLNEPVDRIVLPNGLTALIRPDDSTDVVSVQVWVKTGSIHEAPWLGSGVSHFLEHMLFKGTKRRCGRDISAEVQKHGGHINAYTSYDRTVYYIDLPSEHAEVALDILADAVFNSTLPAKEVVKERDVILREIDMGLDDPDYRVSQGLMSAAFREHPYRHPIVGHREVFSELKRDELVSYHRARYIPNNTVLVVVGAVDPAEMHGTIEKHFGGFERTRQAPVVVPDEPGQLASRSLDLHSDVQVFRAALGYQVPGLAHPDTPALDIVSLIMGHGDSALLWQALRERRKVVHHIDASNWNPGAKGLFFLSMVGDADKGDAAIAALHEEVARICERGFTDAQLSKAVRQAMVGEINVRRTMSGQASRLGLAEVVVGDIGYPATYLNRLAGLTVADLQRVAQSYLDPAVLTTVTMRPRPSGTTAAKPMGKSGSLDFEDEKFPGGARLLWRENHRLPKIHLRVVWRGGPLFETAGRRGATALLANLMTKDTKRRTSGRVAAEIEAVGGSFSHNSGNNSFGLSMEVLPDDIDLALDMLEEAMLHPAFKPTSVSREREAQAAEIIEEADDIVTSARRTLRQHFFGGHPFAIDAAGTAEDVLRISPADLRKLHRKLVVTGNTVLAVSGDFSSAKLLPRLKHILAKLPKGALAGEQTAAVEPANPGEHQLPMDRQQVVVFEAYPSRGLLADDFFVSEVADELFSGMSSNLFERVREEKSLAYFVRSGRMIGLHAGMFYLMAGTNQAGAPQVVKEFARELKRVRDGGVSAEELERCQTRLKAGRRMSMQSNSACASQAALNALYGLPVNEWRSYDARIDAVTERDLRAFVRVQLKASARVRLLTGAVKAGPPRNLVKKRVRRSGQGGR